MNRINFKITAPSGHAKTTLSRGSAAKNITHAPLFMTSLLFAVLFITVSAGLAQNRPSDALFNQLAAQKGITTMSFSQNFIEMIDMAISDDDIESQKVTGPLQEIKMTICNAEEAPGWGSKIEEYMQRRPFSEVETDDKDDDCRVFVNRKGKRIDACHILFKGQKNLVMLSFFGEFKLEDVDQIKRKARELKE